jgi:hypothetical protein
MPLELSLTEMHKKKMMEHIDLQKEQKMKLEDEDIISMTMIEMGFIGMIGMIGIGFKNHKGMSLRNPSRMSGKR